MANLQQIEAALTNAANLQRIAGQKAEEYASAAKAANDATADAFDCLKQVIQQTGS